MDWINNRLAEEKALHERDASITSSAEQIYRDMWEHLLRAIEFAKSKGKPLFTNGSPLDRIVRLSSLSVPAKQPKEFHFALSKDRHSIVVSGEVSMTFKLGICSDNSVCPKDQNGNEVTYDEAAELILDPFLFPSLPRQKLDRKERPMSSDDQDSLARMRHEEEHNEQ